MHASPELNEELLALLRAPSLCYVTSTHARRVPAYSTGNLGGHRRPTHHHQHRRGLRELSGNVQRDPRVGVALSDPNNLIRYITVRGRVVATTTDGGTTCNATHVWGPLVRPEQPDSLHHGPRPASSPPPPTAATEHIERMGAEIPRRPLPVVRRSRTRCPHRRHHRCREVPRSWRSSPGDRRLPSASCAGSSAAVPDRIGDSPNLAGLTGRLRSGRRAGRHRRVEPLGVGGRLRPTIG